MLRQYSLPSVSVASSPNPSQNPQLTYNATDNSNAYDDHKAPSAEEEDGDSTSSSSSDFVLPQEVPKSVLGCIDDFNDKYDGRTSDIISSYFARNAEFLNRKSKDWPQSTVEDYEQTACSLGSVFDRLKIHPCSCVTASQLSFSSSSNSCSESSTSLTSSERADVEDTPSPPKQGNTIANANTMPPSVRAETSKQISTLAALHRNKNFQLLSSWTDEGQYSRVQAMTSAAALLDTKVTESDLQADLNPKEKFAYKMFCLEIEDKLELITKCSYKNGNTLNERTLRKLWHLYALYTKALSEEIWEEGEDKNANWDTPSHAIAYLVKRTIAGPESVENPQRAFPKPAVSLEHINPVLAKCLQDPVHAFLIVYGRYCSIGNVNTVDRLRKLSNFNSVALRFFKLLAEPPECVDVDTYLLHLRRGQLQRQQHEKYRQNRPPNFPRSISLPLSKPRHGRRHRKHKKKHSSTTKNTGIVEKIDGATHHHANLQPPGVPDANMADMKTIQKKIQMLDGVGTDTSDIEEYFPEKKKKRGKKRSDDDEPCTPPEGHAHDVINTPAVSGDESRKSDYDSSSTNESTKKNINIPCTSPRPPTSTPLHVALRKGRQTPPASAQKKLKDLLCRSLLITGKESRPTVVPFKELDDQSRHILRGRFLPKGYERPPPTTTESSSPNFNWVALPQRKKRICLFGCRYDVLPVVASEAGFELVGENELWNINWSDSPLPQDKICQMRRIQDTYSVFWGVSAPLQKTNHFPGMYEICRKDRLGRNLNRLRRLFSSDYCFFPETWDLPTEQTDLLNYAKRRKHVTFIVKPESGCQGKGIFLLRNLKKLSPFTKCVCQVYVPNPFLIDGYKFDQRIYVLITCVDPLRLYIYEEGIARFATVKYEPPTDENLEVVFMHLTNYSLNKFSESYVREGDGSKRKLSAIYRWMSENGHDVPKLIRAIDEVVVKTLLCAAPTLRHNYKTCFPKKDRGCSCFEILGFDILIDKQLNPVLLEVNHSPSFNLDLPVDSEVKKELLRDMFNMVYLGEELSCAKQKRETRRESEKLRMGEGSTTRGKRRSRARSPPSPVKNEPSPSTSSPDILPKPLVNQFKHEIRNRGKFRLIYSSEKPGKYAKLVDETYCGYPSTSTSANTGALLEQLADNQQGRNGRSSRNVAFDNCREDWPGQKSSSILKMMRQGQSHLDTRVIPSDPACSRNAQRGLRLVQPLQPTPRSDLALTRKNIFTTRLRKMQEYAYLQGRTVNEVKMFNNSNYRYNDAEIDISHYAAPHDNDRGKGAGGGGGGGSNLKFQLLIDNKNSNKR